MTTAFLVVMSLLAIVIGVLAACLPKVLTEITVCAIFALLIGYAVVVRLRRLF